MHILGVLFLLAGVVSLVFPIKFIGGRMRSAVLLWVIGIVILSQAPGSESPKSVSQATAEPSSSAPSPASQMPSGQKAFVAAVESARQAYRAGSNDMQKGAARPARAKAICSVLASKSVTDWVGQVARLSSNSDGKGVLGITIAKDVIVTTWNNAVSDIGAQTLIEPDSGLFRRASALSKGQWVKFSGSFRPSDVDCVLESSMTLSGSLTDPDFIFRFSDVAPIGN